MSNTKKSKIFIATASSFKSSADWLDGEVVDTLEEADIVLFEGFRDISPEYYQGIKNKGSYTYCKPEIDKEDFKALQKAVQLKKFIVGVNRGFHLLSVYAGAPMIQHMNHPCHHTIKLYDGTRLVVNSIHHQLPDLEYLDNTKYQVLAYAEGLSDYYLDYNDKDTIYLERDVNHHSIEPEIVEFKEFNGIGFQYNVHHLPKSSQIYHLSSALVRESMRNNIGDIVKFTIPTSRVALKSFEFTEEEKAIITELKEEEEHDKQQFATTEFYT